MSFRHVSRDGTRLSMLAAAALMAFSAVQANAETGSAHARDMSVHISLLGIANLDIDPQITSGFDNTFDAAQDQDSTPSLDIGTPLLHLSSGLITTEAEYAPGVSIAAAGSRVNIENLELSAVGLLGESLLSVTADTIRAQSLVAGYCLPAQQTRSLVDDITFFNGFDEGNLHPGGIGGGGDPGDDVTLTGLGISILGIPVPDLPLNPPPNTVVDLAQLGIADVTLILNERTIGGDGVTNASLSTNAIHLTLNVAGVITGDVVFAHSDSTLACEQ